jgi:hypothetical protein
MKTRVSFYTYLFLFILSISARTAWSQNKSAKANEVGVVLKVVDKDSIRITVKNTGKKTIAAYSHVICRENQYDYLEIEGLTFNQKELLFSFYDDRPTYAPVLAFLRPNEDFSCTISLTDWAERIVNKAMLQKAGLSSLPHGIKIRAKFTINEADSYHGFVWSGTAFSDWVEYK